MSNILRLDVGLFFSLQKTAMENIVFYNFFFFFIKRPVFSVDRSQKLSYNIDTKRRAKKETSLEIDMKPCCIKSSVALT